MPRPRPLTAVTSAMFLLSFGLINFELLLTRLFGIVLFAQFAHLALALAMLGISVGAIAQHLWPDLLPEEGFERRLGWLLLLQGALTLLAVWATVGFPVTKQFEIPPVNFQERSAIKDDLLDPWWFAALLPILTLPFVVAGLSFAGTFQRRKRWIGRLYGADLVGGAAGAVVFLPALRVLAGPDLGFVSTLATTLGATLLFMAIGRRAWVSGAAVAVLAALVTYGATGHDLIRVHFAAGYAEDLVSFSEWTPLCRVSIHEDPRRGTYVLLDNTSASEVFQTERRRADVAEGAANRALVYRISDPDSHVAILAASAGPEVGVAQYFGFHDIDAIDIAGEIFDVVADRFPDDPVNPYLVGPTRRVKADGRAAILHSHQPYDVIQMVHANLWSSAGLLANAWSPALLETREAFGTYLDHLTPDGTISFGRGPATDEIARSAAAALVDRGVTDPWRYIFYARADSSVLLVKGRPWTRTERDKAWEELQHYRHPEWVVDPLATPSKKVRRLLLQRAVMTDDRPYLDDISSLGHHLSRAVKKAEGHGESALTVLYRSILIQVGFVLVAGLLFILVPFLRRGPNQLRGLHGMGKGLMYVSGLGYGYLAIETVLVHELVLFVGHPTYAVTIVILAMLLFSGLGSITAGRLREGRLLPTLRGVLIGVILLGALQAFVVPPLLNTFALGLPLGVRMGITFVALAPLGFIMGMPFPTALRLLRDEASGMVPWAWALNGWMSVVASLVTVLTSRLWGYSWAFALALLAYGAALALAGSIPRIRRVSDAEATR